MEDNIYSVPALEKKYSHDIMLSLLANPRQKKTDLLQSISKSSSMPRRLDELEEAGLVEVERDTYDYNTKWVRLTDKGAKVAELLSLIRFEAKSDKDKA
jgi:DNA-binding MarR family transcriptional regulator